MTKTITEPLCGYCGYAVPKNNEVLLGDCAFHPQCADDYLMANPLPPIKKLVIRVDAEGTAEWTRDKNLQFLFGGEGDMQRVTDIFKRGTHFGIKWLIGPLAVKEHTFAMSVDYGVLEGGVTTTLHEPIMFLTYEAAVAHEILMLNAMRRAGISFKGV